MLCKSFISLFLFSRFLTPNVLHYGFSTREYNYMICLTISLQILTFSGLYFLFYNIVPTGISILCVVNRDIFHLTGHVAKKYCLICAFQRLLEYNTTQFEQIILVMNTHCVNLKQDMS